MKMKKERKRVRGEGVRGGQEGCVQRMEVIVKRKKVGGGEGGQGRCDGEVKLS